MKPGIHPSVPLTMTSNLHLLLFPSRIPANELPIHLEPLSDSLGLQPHPARQWGS